MQYIHKLAVLIMFALMGSAYCASIESLIMPGPLVSSHSELEESCSDCHDLFDRDAQQALCLGCHERIANDLTKSQGFHFLHPDVKTLQCKQCHTDHKGRETDITGLQPDLFDHTFADFQLRGAHKTLTCDSCHISGDGYFEAPSECIQCHKLNDLHQGALGDKCGDCHTQSDWESAKFDHSTTDFSLIGKHKQTNCIQCHVNQKYEDTPSSCIACHRLDDTHGGTHGDSCASCHNAESWLVDYDHGKETGFVLHGAHHSLSCGNCHAGEGEYASMPTDCQGCHRSNDIHIGRNGTACEQCHNQRDWAPDFDHFSDTNFALQGAHAEVSCKACHIGKLTDAVNTECADCHAGSNPHGKLQGDCETCHGQTSWNDEISFHHDLSRFPLIGMHRVTSCEQCHQTLEYSPLAMACSHCHEQDDIHEGSLGEDCTGCHNPVSWSYWVFEHDEVSDFSLDGAHENLVCEACHTRGTSANRQSAACFACHSDDDPHKGRFSRQCDKCHNSSTFSEAHF